MIQVRSLAQSFDERQVLFDIEFDLNDGDNLIILGRSGSGKTVLIKTIMGLLSPCAGSVHINGTDIHQAPANEINTIREKISMVFQNAALLDSYTVFQNIALPLYERGEKSFDEIRTRVSECLDLVGLKDTADMYPSELSGGMRKRIGIARSLVYEPAWIIFDEPISGLDPITAGEILFYMGKIIEKKQVTTITITHDLKDLRNIGNRVLFLQDGKMKFYGEIEQLYRSSDPDIRKFLGSEV